MNVLAINKKYRKQSELGYSVFSMSALAVALTACGGDFKLADDNPATVSGTGGAAALKLTFTEEPKSADKAKIMVTVGSGTATPATSATPSAKSLTINLGANDDNIKVEIKAGGLKDNNDKEFTATYYVDNKAPTVGSVTSSSDKKTVTVTFDEGIGTVDGTKFKIDGKSGTASIDKDDSKKVIITFTEAVDTSKSLTWEKGAVKDDGKVTVGTAAADKDQTAVNPANEIVAGSKAIGGGGSSDTTPPALADGDAATSGDQSLTVDSAKKVFTIHFNEDVTVKDDTKITLEKGGVAVTDDFTVVASGKTVTITFTAAQGAGDYVAKIAAGAVEDKATTPNATTVALTTSSETVPSIDDDGGLLGLGYVSEADYGF